MKKLLLTASLAAVSTLAFANTPLGSTSNAQFYTFGSASTKLSLDYTATKSDNSSLKSTKTTNLNLEGKVKLGLGADFVLTDGFTGGFSTSFSAKKPFYGKKTEKKVYSNRTDSTPSKLKGDELSGTYSLNDTYVYLNVNALGQLTLGKTSTAAGDLLQGGQADAFGGVGMSYSSDLVANYVSPELIPGLVLSYDYAFLGTNSSQYGVKVAYNYAPFTASLSGVQQTEGGKYTRGLEFAVTADDLGLTGLSAYADLQYAYNQSTYTSVKDKKQDETKDFAPLQVLGVNAGASYTLNQYLTASLDLGLTHKVETTHELVKDNAGYYSDKKSEKPTNAFSAALTLESTVYTYDTASLSVTGEGGFTYTKPKGLKGTTELFGSVEAKLSF